MSNPNHEEKPYTAGTLLADWIDSLRYSLTQWRKLFIGAVAGIIVGLGVWFIKNDTYTAKSTFVVEESKGGGGSIVSALAGQFGFDLGNVAGGNGMLAGDNVLQLLKSQSLLKKALLSHWPADTSLSLADVYAISYKYKTKWKNSRKVGRDISFKPSVTAKRDRTEDSLLNVIIKRITDKELSIAKPDKKLTVFALQITTRNEMLSALITQRLLQETATFYIDTKTKRIRGNVERLQQRVDSIAFILNRKTFSAAEATRLLLDANPIYATPEVSAEISARDKFVQSTLYAELLKNLETNKMLLLQETPTFQVIDQPEIPLKINELRWYKALAFGGIGGLIMAATLLLFFRRRDDLS